MALVGEELASDAALDKVLRICSSHRPIKPSTEGLSNKGPSCGVVSGETRVNSRKKLSPFFLGDTSLKYSGSTFIVELSVVNLVGLRAPNNAARFILDFGELLPINVGQERFGPWSNDCHNEMGRRCYFGG